MELSGLGLWLVAAHVLLIPAAMHGLESTKPRAEHDKSSPVALYLYPFSSVGDYVSGRATRR